MLALILNWFKIARLQRRNLALQKENRELYNRVDFWRERSLIVRESSATTITNVKDKENSR
jgi:hypothetical protein